MTPEDDLANAIADSVLKSFAALPASRKPRGAGSGLGALRREWVPLAGIVIEDRSNASSDKRFTCAALATGMKCLPQEKIASVKGNVLHDCHAEILALRAFNRFLMEEATIFSNGQFDSAEKEDCGIVVRNDTIGPPFRISPDIALHMYCSEAPCGDASMELVMDAQEDDTPWTGRKSPSLNDPLSGTLPHSDFDDALYGRGYFGKLGVVRRKPARPDAPVSLSKSCSDKLALKQCTSVLSSISALFIDCQAAYLHSVVLPKSQLVPAACERAFGPTGRMRVITKMAQHPQSPFRPFKVLGTEREFEFSRRAKLTSDTIMVPSNLAAVAFALTQETLINGVLQGRKLGDPKGASALSRRRMWELAIIAAKGLQSADLIAALSQTLYSDLKGVSLLDARQAIKLEARRSALVGWKRNVGDDGWGIAKSN